MGSQAILTTIPEHEIAAHQQLLSEPDLERIRSCYNTNEDTTFYPPSTTMTQQIASKGIKISDEGRTGPEKTIKKTNPVVVGGGGGKRKSMTETVDRIMIKLAKINACNDDGLLRLKDGKLSECTMNRLIRSALSKSCKPEHVEDFVDYLARAKVDPNVFENMEFRKKLLEKIGQSQGSAAKRKTSVPVKRVVSNKAKKEKNEKHLPLISIDSEGEVMDTLEKSRKRSRYIPDDDDDDISSLDESIKEPKPKKRRIQEKPRGTKRKNVIFTDSDDTEIYELEPLLKHKKSKAKRVRGSGHPVLSHLPDDFTIMWSVPS